MPSFQDHGVGFSAWNPFAGPRLLLRYRLMRPLMLWRRPWELVENLDAGGSTRLLRMRPVGHAGFAFEPGQFSWLMPGSNPLWSAQHPLSMVSSAERPADGTIEFGIKALGDWSGTVVPALHPPDPARP
ncbi:hypothetical protein BH23ACI1_BH23ACI1_20840 [soil metagenome]